MNDKRKRMPEDYVALKTWGRRRLSPERSIENEQRRAAEAHAPVDAIYYMKHGSDGWVCVSDLKPDNPFRLQYEASQGCPK